MILHATVSGQGESLLILHGFLGQSDNWKTIVNQLDKSFEVHAIDLRNHGRSFHADDFSYAVMVEDLINYFNHFQLKEAIVLGHSMGGKVAMQLACEHTHLVKKLIVADIGPKYYPLHHQQILAGLQAIDFSTQPTRSEAESTLALYITDFGVRQFLLKNLFWKTPGQLDFRFHLKALVNNIEEIGLALPDHLHFEKETLFLRGANSNYILDDDWVGIQRQFPKANLETIPNAGHWLHAEQPQIFLEKLNQFLI
jgi:pimeloyl-ACP methyl ester carboxylesterase